MDDSLTNYFKHGFQPGGCYSNLVRGDIERAYQSMHPWLKQSYESWCEDPDGKNSGRYNLVQYMIELLPPIAKGQNFEKWCNQGGWFGASEEVKMLCKIQMTPEAWSVYVEEEY